MKRPITHTLLGLLLLGLLLLLLSGASLAAPAEDEFELAYWFEIGGGGSWMSSGDGEYLLGATAGQSGVGEEPMTGGEYSLIGGFWSPLDENLLYLPVAAQKK